MAPILDGDRNHVSCLPSTEPELTGNDMMRARVSRSACVCTRESCRSNGWLGLPVEETSLHRQSTPCPIYNRASLASSESDIKVEDQFTPSVKLQLSYKGQAPLAQGQAPLVQGQPPALAQGQPPPLYKVKLQLSRRRSSMPHPRSNIASLRLKCILVCVLPPSSAISQTLPTTSKQASGRSSMTQWPCGKQRRSKLTPQFAKISMIAALDRLGMSYKKTPIPYNRL